MCFEIVINKRGSNMEEKQEKSLSDKDKNLIKQAVLLSAVKNTNLPPDNIAKALCRAFTFIDLYGR